MDPLRHVKPSVRGLAAYTLRDQTAPVKLNQNESPYDVPETLKRRVTSEALARPWSRYPSLSPTDLIQALANFAGWRADGIVAGNGSNELIEALLRVTVGPGTPVVIPEPTFSLYAMLTTILEGRAVRVGLGPGLEYDGEAIARARRESQAPVTIVCSPNNPTGGTIASEEIARLCAESDGLVVLDEAYHEFAEQSAVPLLAEHANLVILRTFSKAMGLAGLRVGYLLAAPELAREISKARVPYAMSFFSERAALAALEEAPALQENVKKLIRLRETLAARLSATPGVRTFPSRANFILFELLDAEPRQVYEGLRRQGVLVRDVTGYPRLGRCLRVSVGSEEQNELFCQALEGALAEARAVVGG